MNRCLFFSRWRIVVAALKYYETGRSLYLILASISAALMVATKETWIMNGPVLVIAWISTALYFWLREQFGSGSATRILWRIDCVKQSTGLVAGSRSSRSPSRRLPYSSWSPFCSTHHSLRIIPKA